MRRNWLRARIKVRTPEQFARWEKLKERIERVRLEQQEEESKREERRT